MQKGIRKLKRKSSRVQVMGMSDVGPHGNFTGMLILSSVADGRNDVISCVNTNIDGSLARTAFGLRLLCAAFWKRSTWHTSCSQGEAE